MKYAELFSGIGGFRNAAELISNDTNVKLRCVGFSEIDQYAITTYNNNYELNGETRMHDITQFVEDKKQMRQMDEIDLLLGGFPCQSFSLLGKNLGLEDERGKILFSIDKLLRKKKPKFIYWKM
jgi:DNA (cytosine-5)-methyltransferase 1